MSTNNSTNDLETLAVAALRELLNEVSVVKLKEIKCKPQGKGGDRSLVAHVDVLGRSHTLACKVSSSAQPEGIRSTLRKLGDRAAQKDGAATPVIIAPYLSPEVQAMCKESHVGFLDFEGTGRIALGEVFIGKRSLLPRGAHLSAAASVLAVEPLVIKQFPPARAAVKPADYPPIAIPA